MICEVKSKVAKTGRSAGQRWCIIGMEDLEGKVEGMVFAEAFAQISERHPNALKNESICFVRGKVDKKREVPSLLVNDVIPVADAAARLTTAVALKLDPARHTPDVAAQLEEAIKRHKGGIEVFVQIATGVDSKIVMRLDKDRFVRPTQQLVDDLELLLGAGCVQLCGLGTKRRKKQQPQPQLFQEESVAGDDADISPALLESPDPSEDSAPVEPAAELEPENV
jgi:DNA polymerase-3 subunit alpha